MSLTDTRANRLKRLGREHRRGQSIAERARLALIEEIMAAHYEDKASYREISEAVGITSSRVHQIVIANSSATRTTPSG